MSRPSHDREATLGRWRLSESRRFDRIANIYDSRSAGASNRYGWRGRGEPRRTPLRPRAASRWRGISGGRAHQQHRDMVKAVSRYGDDGARHVKDDHAALTHGFADPGRQRIAQAMRPPGQRLTPGRLPGQERLSVQRLVFLGYRRLPEPRRAREHDPPLPPDGADDAAHQVDGEM
jgi:hypothetical protein